jgi:hypothetical protein
MSMNDAKPDIKETLRDVLSESERITALMKPELEARRDTAKTLISLSGATLVFTITFSQSVIKPETPLSWRYLVIGAWLGFICSLVCCLASLWISMGLQSLPVVIKAKESEVEECLRAGTGSDIQQATNISMRGFRKIRRQETVALWFLRFGLIFYGLALSTFTAIGLYQLLR